MNMNEPKLRFKADDGSQFPDWEEKTLGDIGTAKMCKRVLKEQTSEKGDVPFYKIGTFGGTPDAFISRELYEELKTKYSFPRKGNILLSAAGTIGRTVVYDGQDAFFQDSNIVWLDNDDSVLDGFLLQFYNKTSWDNLEGGTIKRLYNGLFLSKVIHVPSLPEQQKIAEFLVAIGTVIEKQKETVSAWEERKKGVMQKLFSQEVRFKADDGSEFPEWEEKSFSDVFENLNNSTFSRDCLNYETGNVKYIHYGDILIKFGFVIDVQSSNVPYVNEDLNCEKYASLSEGDIVIADTAEDDTVGKAVEVMNTHWGKTISGLHTIACHPMGKFASKYLGYFMNSDIYHNQLRPYMQGIKVTSVSKTNIALTKILVPCLVEQQKIADCLSALDEVIEKQKATLAAWEELKKGLLQQMFV